jgi:hypothetical protein
MQKEPFPAEAYVKKSVYRSWPLLETESARTATHATNKKNHRPNEFFIPLLTKDNINASISLSRVYRKYPQNFFSIKIKDIIAFNEIFEKIISSNIRRDY